MALSTKIKNISYLNPEFEKLPLKKLFVASFLISIATIILGVIAQLILPPEVPLYYGLPQTRDQIAPSLFVVLPSAVSIITTILNALFSIKTHDNYLKKALAFTSIAVSILATITTYKIIFLVGSI